LEIELNVPRDLSPQDVHRKGAVGLKVLNQLPPKKCRPSHFYSSEISFPEIAVENSDAQHSHEANIRGGNICPKAC
jgi:hypothetical protein